MPTVRDLMNDEKFMALGPRDKIGLLTLVSPEFRGLSPEERQAVAMHLSPIAAQAEKNKQRIESNAALPEAVKPEEPGVMGFVKRGFSNLYDELAGEGKSFIRAGYEPYRHVANAIQNRPADTPRNPNFEAALEPQSDREAGGQMKANLAMALLPVGPAKALEAEVALTRGPALVRAVLNGLSRAAIQGGTAAAVAGAQGQDQGMPAGVAGAIGALEPAIAHGSQSLAEQLVNRNVLRAKPSTYLHGANPGRGVVNNGIVSTEANLPARIAAAKNASGQVVDRQVANIPGSFDPVAPLNNATDTAVQRSTYDGAPVGRLEDFRSGRTQQIADAAGLPPGARPTRVAMNAPDVNAIKRDVGDSINWKSRLEDPPALTDLRQRYYNDLNSFTRVPENANYADLSEAGKAINAKLNATPPSLIEKLIKRSMMAGLVGTARGASSGDWGHGGRDAAATLLLEYMLGNAPAQLGMAQGLRGVSAASPMIPQLAGHAVGTR